MCLRLDIALNISRNPFEPIHVRRQLSGSPTQAYLQQIHFSKTAEGLYQDIPGYPGARNERIPRYRNVCMCPHFDTLHYTPQKKHVRILNTHTKNNTPPLVCTHCMYLLQSAKEKGESFVALWSMCLPADRAVSGLPSRIIIYVPGNKIAKCSSTRYVFEHQGGSSSTDVFSFTALSLV